MDAALSGQCVLITGASGGIGLAAARMFAAEGTRLILHYHSQAAPLEALANELDVEHLVVQADLRDEKQTDAMFERGLERFGRIDCLVANAGAFHAPSMPLCDMPFGQWRNTLAVDLDSVFFTCRAFLRGLKQDPRESASIVMVGSTAAIFGEEGHADYSAAKAAMTYGLTFSLKNEIVRLAPRGRVNCVCPGWTRTPMAEYGLSDEATVRRVHSTMALRKIAEPEDVASAIVYFASERLSGHQSGAVLPVAGGMEGRLLHRNEY